MDGKSIGFKNRLKVCYIREILKSSYSEYLLLTLRKNQCELVEFVAKPFLEAKARCTNPDSYREHSFNLICDQ